MDGVVFSCAGDIVVFLDAVVKLLCAAEVPDKCGEFPEFVV